MMYLFFRFPLSLRFPIFFFFAWHEYCVSRISFFVALFLLFFHHSVMGSFLNPQGMSAFVAGGVLRADSTDNDTNFVP